MHDQFDPLLKSLFPSWEKIFYFLVGILLVLVCLIFLFKN
jgi:uncharacterized membrane protein YuzA (DUF378 family)